MNFSINRTFLAGLLARDPESRQVGQSVLTTIAIETSRSYTYQGATKVEDATVEVEFFGKAGDEVRVKGKAGMLVHVEARLKVFNSTSQAGKAYSKLSVAGESIQFIGAGKSSYPEKPDNSNFNQPRPANVAPVRMAPAAPAPAAAFDDDDSNVPF